MAKLHDQVRFNLKYGFDHLEMLNPLSDKLSINYLSNNGVSSKYLNTL